MKLGGEYLYAINAAFGCLYCMGAIDAQGGPVPANIEQLFPVWNDVSTWNLDGAGAHRPALSVWHRTVPEFPARGTTRPRGCRTTGRSPRG